MDQSVKMIRHGQSYWWSPIVPVDKSLQIEQQTYDIYRQQEQHLNPKMLVLNYDILVVVVELCTIYYIIYYNISYAQLYIILCLTRINRCGFKRKNITFYASFSLPGFVTYTNTFYTVSVERAVKGTFTNMWDPHDNRRKKYY